MRIKSVSVCDLTTNIEMWRKKNRKMIDFFSYLVFLSMNKCRERKTKYSKMPPQRPQNKVPI